MSPKYLDLKSRKIETVAALISALQKLPSDTKIIGLDADIGGYSVSHQNYCEVRYDAENKTATIGHMEEEAWRASQPRSGHDAAMAQPELTEEEAREFIESTRGIATPT